MTGTIFDIKRYAIHDGPGIRTAVFLKGCPLRCSWCHNPESQSAGIELLYRQKSCIGCGRCEQACPEKAIQLEHAAEARPRRPRVAGEEGWQAVDSSPNLSLLPRKAAGGITIDRAACTRCGVCAAECPSEALVMVGRRVTPESLMVDIARDKTFFDESGGGVTFSGGEPLSQPAFLAEMLDRCGAEGLHRAVDTSGFAPAAVIRDIAPRTDLFLYDLKLMDDARSLEFTGVPAAGILANLRAIAETDAGIEIRFPVIPSITDGDDNLAAMGAFLVSLPRKVPVRLLPYHSAGTHKYERFGVEHRLGDIREPAPEAIRTIAGKLRDYRLEVTHE